MKYTLQRRLKIQLSSQDALTLEKNKPSKNSRIKLFLYFSYLLFFVTLVDKKTQQNMWLTRFPFAYQGPLTDNP